MSKPSNPPAFAVPAVVAGEHTAYDSQTGMSLLDYFAAKAMPKIISLTQHHDGSWDMGTVAIGAYQMAEAMLKEREARNG